MKKDDESIDWSQYIQKPNQEEVDWSQYANNPPNNEGLSEANKKTPTPLSLLKALGKFGLSTAGGGAQGVANSGISAVNAFNSGVPGLAGALTPYDLEDLETKDIPHLDTREYYPEGGVNSFGFGLGDILGSLYGINKAGNALKGIQGAFEAPQLGKYHRIAGDVARGATAGALTGEGDLGGRAGSAAVGGTAELLANALSRSRALGKLLNDKEAGLEPAKQLYNEIGKTLTEAGKNSGLKSPTIKWDALENAVKEQDLKPIKKLLEKGTYESFNQAQSKLSSIARNLNKRIAAGAGPEVIKSYNAVKNAERKIHGKLFERFSEVGQGLPDKYQEANALYAKAIAPFDFPPLKEYEKLIGDYGKPTKSLNKNTLDRLLADDEFMMATGQHYPELGLSNYVNPLSKFLSKIIKGK